MRVGTLLLHQDGVPNEVIELIPFGRPPLST